MVLCESIAGLPMKVDPLLVRKSSVLRPRSLLLPPNHRHRFSYLMSLFQMLWRYAISNYLAYRSANMRNPSFSCHSLATRRLFFLDCHQIPLRRRSLYLYSWPILLEYQSPKWLLRRRRRHRLHGPGTLRASSSPDEVFANNISHLDQANTPYRYHSLDPTPL